MQKTGQKHYQDHQGEFGGRAGCVMTDGPRLSASGGVQLPRNWRRLCRKVLRRCDDRCEWQRADLGVRCTLPATMIVHGGKPDDHSLKNLLGLCAWHAAQKAAREWEASQFIAIRVRPQPPEDKA
jgi:hypothetical protein